MNSSRIEHSEDYQRIAAAIAFMRKNYRSQPDLATVANHVGLSESYFQRLFTQWAGISPKRFLQYLTVEYAKSKIQQTKSLLDLTLDIGLSSPGRLHDLFVNVEAMSPGEFKAGGAGLTIHYGLHETTFGQALIATTPRGICNLYFLDDLEDHFSNKNEDIAMNQSLTDQLTLTPKQLLQQTWPNADIIHNPTMTRSLHHLIFDAEAFTEPKSLTLLVKGTNFQLQVWRALLKIPFGEMTTYQAIANLIGRPTATRAVGNAVGSNPIGYLIPCHRVIRESGELGGYRWGLERKTMILGWEASRSDKKSDVAPQRN